MIDKALERKRKLDLTHQPESNIPKPQHDEPPQQDGIQLDGLREKTTFKRRVKHREWLLRTYADPLFNKSTNN